MDLKPVSQRWNRSKRMVIWIRTTFFSPSSVSSNTGKIILTSPPAISGRRFSSPIFRQKRYFWKNDCGIAKKRRASAPFLPALVNRRTDLLLVDLCQRFVLLRTQPGYIDRFHVFENLSTVSRTGNDTADFRMIENPA